mmetsp:Transcript_45384/g.116144  ORF Transcript_45384/g.116144 Transcript_45384/m.116144 type:complete len:508 (+) Transcript_45384:407-1930(+)
MAKLPLQPEGVGYSSQSACRDSTGQGRSWGSAPRGRRGTGVGARARRLGGAARVWLLAAAVLLASGLACAGRRRFPYPPVKYSRHGLCFDGPGDTEQTFRSEVRTSATLPDHGEPFSDELIAKFPFAVTEHCDRMREQRLQLVTRDCKLMGFDPSRFLRIIKGRKLVFWGDSVARQFFNYLQLRLDAYALPAVGNFAGRSSKLEPADPKRCVLHRFFNLQRGLQLSTACFKLPPADWDKDHTCVYFHDREVGTAICYVKAGLTVVDDRNVVFLNAMTENDIMFANIGLHHNHVRSLQRELEIFAGLLHHVAQERQLPLILWRETTAQHFNGGEGGNWPTLLAEEMHSIVPGKFKCTKHRFKVMRQTNWRNDLLRDWGFQWRGPNSTIALKIPILNTWNLTAMADEQHPRYLTLGGGTNTTSTADCTHFCPHFGGMYEVLTQVLYNGLHALQPFKQNLRPALLESPAYGDPGTQQPGDPETLKLLSRSFKLDRQKIKQMKSALDDALR